MRLRAGSGETSISQCDRWWSWQLTDSEDHLQTTTFISCTAVSDAKNDTSGDNTAYDATQAEKRGLLTWARFTSGLVCIIQTTCISFVMVQATKGELRKLKFKTLNLLCYRAGLQQGVIPSSCLERELNFHKPGTNKAEAFQIDVIEKCSKTAQKRDKEGADGCEEQSSLSVYRGVIC